MSRLLIVVLALLLVSGCGSDDTHSDSMRKSSPEGDSDITKTEGAANVAQPAKIFIPDIDVGADLVKVGLEDDGSMQTPAYNQNQAGWYTEGPMPGEPGPAVIAAHVDNKQGPDVFARLADLQPGDTVSIADKTGSKYTWKVDEIEQHDKDELPYEKVWNSTDAPVLRLITCAGDYVRDEYEDNLIVYASPATEFADKTAPHD